MAPSSETQLATSPSASMRALGAVTLLFAMASLIFATYAMHSALPANAIELPFERATHMRDWFPEGWAFFTAPAQHSTTIPFKHNDGAWVSANAGPNGSASNAFGFTRAARVQSLEIQILLEQTPPDGWTTCDEANASCFDHAMVHQVSNRAHHPTLCGEVVIAEQKPVPWAWSKLKKPFSMPAKVLRMDVKC